MKGEAAAIYLSKYVTKGVDLEAMHGVLAGEILSAWYGKRKVSTSRGFWKPLDARGPSCCRRCQEEWRVTERPKSLVKVSPEAIVIAIELGFQRFGHGPPQVRVRADLNAPTRSVGLH